MRAGLYARSTAPNQSVDPQLLTLASYAAEHNWTAVEFVDRGESSDGSLAHDGLDALLVAAERQEIDVVLVTRLDCLGHSFKHLLDILGRFEASGVTFACIDDGTETRTPVRRFLAKVRRAAAKCAKLRGAKLAPSDWAA